LLTVREGAGFGRDHLVAHLEQQGIQTRTLFAGNLLKHPCFDELRAAKEGYRVVDRLVNSDRIMRDTFWVGVYPGLSSEMIDFMVENIRGCCQ
jgi:CDP-6-deoxy-D-xylo-4-hexulose-3-dehydrase